MNIKEYVAVKKGLKFADLSDKLGIHRTVMSRIANGKTKGPNSDQVIRISRETGGMVSVVEILANCCKIDRKDLVSDPVILIQIPQVTLPIIKGLLRELRTLREEVGIPTKSVFEIEAEKLITGTE